MTKSVMDKTKTAEFNNTSNLCSICKKQSKCGDSGVTFCYGFERRATR